MPEGIYIPGLAVMKLVISGRKVIWAPGEVDRWLDQEVHQYSVSGNSVYHLATDNTLRDVCDTQTPARATFLANVLNRHTKCSDMPRKETRS